MKSRRKLQILYFDLTDNFFDCCKPEEGKNTCRFLDNLAGTPYCTRFTEEGVLRNKKAEDGLQHEEGIGCDATVGEIIRMKSALIGKSIQYSHGRHVFLEKMVVEDIVYKKHAKKFIISIKTDRDIFPFTVNTDFLCIYKGLNYHFVSKLGDHSGAVDIIM